MDLAVQGVPEQLPPPWGQVTETRDCRDYSSPLIINHCLLSRLTETRLMRQVLGQSRGLVKETRVQVVFSLIPSVAGKNAEMNRRAHLINMWLKDGCYGRNFGFFDHGMVYTSQGLMETSEVYCLNEGKGF